MPNLFRILCASAFLPALLLRADEPPSGVRFELSFPESARSAPVDGRIYVVLTRKATPEPRLQFGKTGGQYASSPFFGEDVEGLRPGAAAVIDDRANGYP